MKRCILMCALCATPFLPAVAETPITLPEAIINPAPLRHAPLDHPGGPEQGAAPAELPVPAAIPEEALPADPGVEPAVVTVPKEEEDPNRPKTAAELLEEEIEAINRDKDLLSAQNGLFDERLRHELAELRAEKERIVTQMGLAEEKNRQGQVDRTREIARLKLEKEELSTKAELALSRAEIRHQAEVAELKRQEEKLKLENLIQQARFAKEFNELKQQEAHIKAERAMLDFDIAKMDHRLRQREKGEELEGLVSREKIAYTTNPLQGDSLILSDRVITLNGPIWYETSDYISERINYFNNKNSEYPIFIVIDNSPGGSVMAGYKILKAMAGSEAPVHVVVKSFAASMAAAIATLADVSYAYPNAIILHHQLSYGSGGNLTQHSEMLDEAAEWYKRLSLPIAEKMGVSLEDMVAQMYENNSDGDWNEFADVAKDLHWIDHVVEEIRETSRLENPDKKPPVSFSIFASNELSDEKGRPFVRLPRLQPFDAWWMYNPDRYYRTWMD